MTDHIEDHSRYVIKGEYAGSALPGKIQQLDRAIFIEAGAHVKGAVMGGDIVFMATPFHVDQSVLSRRDIKIRSLDQRGVLGSGVLARGSIVVEKESDFEQGVLAVYGDVHAASLNLTNTVVFGNVFAKMVRLRNCFIMGTVHAERRLLIENTTVGTYNAGNVEFGSNVKMVFPYAISSSRPKFGADVRCMTLVNLQQCMFSENQKLDTANLFSLSEDDLLKAPVEMTITDSGEERTKNITMYTIGPGERILDTERCKESVASNRKVLQYLALRGSIDPREHPEHEEFLRNLPGVERRMLHVARTAV